MADPLNPHAAEIADKELHGNHPELGGRALTASPADAAYRSEWMMYYNAIDEADRKRFGECKVGDAVTACPAAAPTAGWTQEGVLDILCKSGNSWAVDVLGHPDATTQRIDRILYVDKEFPVDAAGKPTGNFPISARAFEGGGSNSAARREINLLSGISNEEAASTIVHEARHQVQPSGGGWIANEVDAYAVEEVYRIEQGMKDRGLRGVDAAGNAVPDLDAIKNFVTAEYPVEPGWFPGPQISEGVTDVSSGWKCAGTKP